MEDMLRFYLDAILATLNFVFAAEYLHKEQYMVFGFYLLGGILFVLKAAALLISMVVL